MSSSRRRQIKSNWERGVGKTSREKNKDWRNEIKTGVYVFDVCPNWQRITRRHLNNWNWKNEASSILSSGSQPVCVENVLGCGQISVRWHFTNQLLLRVKEDNFSDKQGCHVPKKVVKRAKVYPKHGFRRKDFKLGRTKCIFRGKAKSHPLPKQTLLEKLKLVREMKIHWKI